MPSRNFAARALKDTMNEHSIRGAITEWLQAEQRLASTKTQAYGLHAGLPATEVAMHKVGQVRNG